MNRGNLFYLLGRIGRFSKAFVVLRRRHLNLHPRLEPEATGVGTKVEDPRHRKRRRMPSVVKLDRAIASDAAGIAAVYLASRADALPYLRRVHTDDEIRNWISTVLLVRSETWVARIDHRIVGFMALVGDDLDQLYVLPGFYRRGIGRRFLHLAKARSPHRLRLFTFQKNERARAFYEAHGFRIVDMSDGTRNEEREPDVLYEWRAGTDS
jgi:GNAT superfamily N-acetyltransferase